MSIPATAKEATVEGQLVSPLLAALGYGSHDIEAKYAVTFQEGRKGRKPEADFAVFDGASRELGNCLFIVEAKRPGESFEDANKQAESYAMQLRALLYLVTDGVSIEIWQYRQTLKSEQVLKCDASALVANRVALESLLVPAALRAYRSQFREPSLTRLSFNVDAYEQAELERLANRPTTISRTLSKGEDTGEKMPTVGSDEMFDDQVKGIALYTTVVGVVVA
jgi:hypothetical protein